MAGRRSRKDPARVRLQPADAFDLIRWLARSQSDPRKAMAELVQNAIDAGARTITLERRRRGRRASLMVRDDGEGIRPTEEREAALRYLATHIGRSHKRNLSPAERHQRENLARRSMTQDRDAGEARFGQHQTGSREGADGGTGEPGGGCGCN